jgi:anaphase-promoting complex subunit 4
MMSRLCSYQGQKVRASASYVIRSDTCADDSSRLLSLPYRPSTDDNGGILAYKDLTFSVFETDISNRQAGSIEADAQFDQGFLQPYTKHVFATSDGFKPVKIEVNGRKNRRICVVLGEDGRQMKIYDLDFNDDADDWVDIGEEKMGGDHIMSG